MAGEVSFKAYLNKNGGDAKLEVRRFSLDHDVATSFIYLKEKLRAIFPAVSLSQSFDIYWKDGDGDQVTIASDDELTIALTESRNEDVMKLYITNASEPPSDNTPKGPNHEGVTCDICDQPIQGFRYKCLGCHDFDLCSKCEAKGVHGEHFTLRIPSPLNMRHHFGHRLINKISKAARRAESRCPWTHRYENNLAADFSTNCTTQEQAAPSNPRYFRPGMKCGSRRGSGTSNAGETKQSGQSGCEDPKECGKSCGASQAEARPVLNLDPLQIPNVIFNTLADFGIDLGRIDLSQIFPPASAAQGANTNANTAAASATQGESSGQTFNNTKENQSNKQEQPKKKTADNGQADESSAPKLAKMGAAAASTQTASAANVAPTAASATNVAPTAASTTNVAPTAASTTNVAPTAAPSLVTFLNDARTEPKRNSLVEDDWTVYNPNESQEVPAAVPEPIEIDLEAEINNSSQSSGAATPSNGAGASSSGVDGGPRTSIPLNILYPDLTPVTTPIPRSKKVMEAQNQMMAMGFKNDDGWLTDLLNLEDGNIARVLDLIQNKAQGKK